MIKYISILLGALAWVVGNMIYSDFSKGSFLPGTRVAVVLVSALVGTLPGLLCYKEIFLCNIRCIVVGVTIGIIAVQKRKELILLFLCGVFIIEVLCLAIRFLYNRQAREKGKQGFRVAPLIYRSKHKGLSVLVSPSIYKIRDTKKLIRIWLIQLVLSAVTLCLFDVNGSNGGSI